jgi:dTDP-4-dehydrorhamnose 3,5-epimerase-like enzyme
MVKKEMVKRFSDERGFVFEPVEGDQLTNQKNTHVVVSRPGAVRGNHYHQKGSEILVVCGPALVRLCKEGKIEDYSIDPGETIRLVIPPGISHAVQNTGDTDSVLVAFNTESHDPGHPDAVRDILI